MPKLEKSNWDKETWTELSDFNSDLNRGITTLYAKEFSDGWHYAIVHAWYGAHTPLVEFANGVVIFGGED